MCPYYRPEDQRCNITDTWQDGDYQRNTYCLSSANFGKCANYEGASDTAKATKMVR